MELNPFTIRFAFCEALNTYGYVKEASQLAYELAMELFNNPPNTLLVFSHLEQRQNSEEFDFEQDYVPNYNVGTIKTSKKQPIDSTKCHKLSELVATTLWRTIYLIKILISVENSKIYSFVIEFALRMLKNPRGPASTRYLEVYIQSLV